MLPAIIDHPAILDAVCEGASDGAILTDAAGTIIHVNPRAEVLLGVSRERLAGQPMVRFVPASRPSRRQLVGVVRPDGTELSLDLALCAIHADEGEFTLALFQELDEPSKRTRAVPPLEARARTRVDAAGTPIPPERGDSLAYLRAVLDQTPVGLVLIHGAGSDQIETNAQAVEMLGRRIETFPPYMGALAGIDGKPLERERLPSVRAARGAARRAGVSASHRGTISAPGRGERGPDSRSAR